jgi:hypothetical protein
MSGAGRGVGVGFFDGVTDFTAVRAGSLIGWSLPESGRKHQRNNVMRRNRGDGRRSGMRCAL